MASKSGSSSHAKCPDCNCPDCNFTTNSPQELFNHIKDKHTVQAPPPSPPSGPLPIRKNQKKCFICKKSFPKADECFQHISRSHGPLNCSCGRCTKKTDTHKFLVRSSAKDGDNLYDVFRCALCDDAFLGLCRALVHCSEEHIEDPFECAQCNSTYKTYMDLSKHMATHLEDSQNAPIIQARCSYCKSGSHMGTKFFNRPLDLYKHMVQVHNYEEEMKARKKFEATHKAKFPHLYRNQNARPAPPSTATKPSTSTRSGPAVKDDDSDSDAGSKKAKGTKRGRAHTSKSSTGRKRKEPAKEKEPEGVQIPCSMNCNLTFKSFMSFKNHMVTFHKIKQDHATLVEVGKQYGYEDTAEKDPLKSSDDEKPDNESSDDDWAPGGSAPRIGTRKSKRTRYTRTVKPSAPSPVPSPEAAPSPAGSGASSDLSSLTSRSSPIDNTVQQGDVPSKIKPEPKDDDNVDHDGDAQNQVPDQAAPSASATSSDQRTPLQSSQKGHGEKEDCPDTNCKACQLAGKIATTPCKIIIKKEPLDYPLPPHPDAASPYNTLPFAQETQSGFMSNSGTSYVSQSSGIAASPYAASLPGSGTMSYATTSANVDRCVQCLSNTIAKNICHHCGLIFLDPDVYTLHKLWHDREDPFKCSYCGKSCGSRYLFTTHIFRDPHP